MKNWKAAGEGVRDQPDPTDSLLTLSLPSCLCPVSLRPGMCAQLLGETDTTSPSTGAAIKNKHRLQGTGHAEEMGGSVLK